MNEQWGGGPSYYYGGGRGAPPATEAEKLERLKKWAENAHEYLLRASKTYEDAASKYQKALRASEAECTCCPKHGNQQNPVV